MALPDPIKDAALQQARARLAMEGVTVKRWAEENGFDAMLVYAVLSGRIRARSGKSHEVAVRLGLKPAAVVLQPTETDGTLMPSREVTPGK